MSSISARNWMIGDRESGELMESYQVNGVECQLGHTTKAAWEKQMAVVLTDFEVDTPLQKAMSGTLKGISLYGDEQIVQWKNRVAAYPDELRSRMVTHHLNFFPVWHMGDRFFGRDANLWFHQIRVETFQRMLGVLAGINRVYYTTFQFKHAEQFLDELKLGPQDLYARIELILNTDPRPAADMLGALVSEVVDLVEREMPEIDTSMVRRQFKRRFEPWSM